MREMKDSILDGEKYLMMGYLLNFFNVYAVYLKQKNRLKYPKTFAYVGTHTCAQS